VKKKFPAKEKKKTQRGIIIKYIKKLGEKKCSLNGKGGGTETKREFKDQYIPYNKSVWKKRYIPGSRNEGEPGFLSKGLSKIRKKK